MNKNRKSTVFFILEPQKEVVSIYNDNFTTPESRYPYFIELYRCVKVEYPKYFDFCGTDKYPVQASMMKIEIVVPDLTNNEWDASKTKKFYRYIVYNHTSCKCGSLRERKLYNTSLNNLGRYNNKIFHSSLPAVLHARQKC